MAITVAKGTAVLVKIGDAGDPEEFAHPCMINTSRSFTIDGATTADNVENCDDTDAPADVYNYKSSVSVAVEGAGKLDAADILFWTQWAAGPDPKNVKLYVGATLIATMPMQCTKFGVTGEPHKNAECAVSLVSHGHVTIA